MKKLKIVTGEDNPVLRSVAAPIKSFDGNLKSLVKGMERAMVKAKGIGIAAPQVGESVRVFLAVLGQGGAREKTVPMVNPEILEWSEKTDVAEEGCLSLPGIYGKVRRSVGVRVAFLDVEGARVEMALEGLDARVVQHELDHLNGVLFIDKLWDGKTEDLLM